MSENVAVVTANNAQSLLIEESLKRPVLVDFWADWCAPCKNLMPILEKLANEYAGDFLLAKVNADEENMIAAQFGVRSLPTVMLIKDGQPVDGFTGALTESQVKAFLEKHLPSPWQKIAEQAKVLLNDNQFAEALALLQPAYSESGGAIEITLALAATQIGSKRLDEAELTLQTVKMVDQNAEYQQLVSQLELAREAKKAPEIEALEKELQQNPENAEVKFQLAVQYSQHEYYREALDILYSIICVDLGFRGGEAKKIFMDVISVLGKGDPVAVEYQRKLYTLLY